MRIVYDDAMQKFFLSKFEVFMSSLVPYSLAEYDYGMDRIQPRLFKTAFNLFLDAANMEIGVAESHRYGIGNNNRHPVYYKSSNNEIQICAYININKGMYSEIFVSIEDYNESRISRCYTITPRRIEIKT